MRSEERIPLLRPQSREARSRVGEGVTIAVGLCVLFAVGAVVRPDASLKSSLFVEVDGEWEEFKRTYGKAYASPDDERAAQWNFRQRKADLDARNAANGEEVFGVTRYADRPLSEPAFARGFSNTRRRRPQGPGRGKENRGNTTTSSRLVDLGEWAAARTATAELRSAASVSEGVVDWRFVVGALTPVKNQGQCGSCWAVSACEQIESQFVLAGMPQVEFSVQQLASCDAASDGCGGGDPTTAYDYLATVPGLAPVNFWPYEQGLTPDDECLDRTCTEPCDRNLHDLQTYHSYVGYYATVLDYAYAAPPCHDDDEKCEKVDLDALVRAAAAMPLSVCVNAQNWDDYVGGVLTADACGGSGIDDIDHCVQLVGFNATAGYWILRNSWSADWGDDGFIYLEFGPNTCGIANEATVALIDVPTAEDPKKKPTDAGPQ